MSNNLKLPLQVSLGNIAKLGADRAINILGKSLPASVVSVNGQIVTIKFEVLSDYNMPNIDVPLAGSEYTIEPIQQGCKGIVVAIDADVSGISGLNDNVADLFITGNLSSLVFFPIGNKKWRIVDHNIYYATGINDLMLRDDTRQLQLSDEKAAWDTLITDINNLLLIIGPLLTTPTVLTPIVASTVNPVKARV